MAATFHSEAGRNLSLLSALSLDDVTLLGTDHVLVGRSILVVVKAGTTENLGGGTVLGLSGVSEHKNLKGLGQLLHVPPNEAAVGRSRHALRALLLGSEPGGAIDGVVVRFFQHGGVGWLDNTRGMSATQIEEGKGTVVLTSHNNVRQLVVEGHGAERRLTLKSLLGEVGVVQIPDVRLLGHVWRHLLETELSVRNTHALLNWIWVPDNLVGSTLNVVGVLEDHNGLR